MVKMVQEVREQPRDVPAGPQEAPTLWLPSHGEYRATLQPCRQGCPHANRQGHPSPFTRSWSLGSELVPGYAPSALAQLLLTPKAEHSSTAEQTGPGNSMVQLPAPHQSPSKGQHCPLRSCQPQSSVWEGKRMDTSLEPAIAAQPPTDAPSALPLLSAGTAQGSAEVPAQPSWSLNWHLPTKKQQPSGSGLLQRNQEGHGGTGSTHTCPNQGPP